jgi:hypothetical protein
MGHKTSKSINCFSDYSTDYNKCENINEVPELKNHLDSIKDELIKTHAEWGKRPMSKYGTNTLSLLKIPYIVKYGIERYYNALRLKKVIQKYNLYLLAIPDKYIYTFENNENDEGNNSKITNENSVVVCKKVKAKTGKLSKTQTQQLYTFVIKAQYYYLHKLNYIIDANDGKVYIIDTGNSEVISEREAKQNRLDYLIYGNHIHFAGKINKNPIINDPITLLELNLYSRTNIYRTDAYEWLREKVNEREKQRMKLKIALENYMEILNIDPNNMDSMKLKTAYLEYDHDLYK